MYTEFDDCSFSRSTVMIRGPEIRNWSRDCDHANLRDTVISRLVFHMGKQCVQSLKSLALALPEIF